MALGISSPGPAQDFPDLRDARVEPVPFVAVQGWADDRHEEAFAVFLRSCAPPAPLRQGAARSGSLEAVCKAALSLAGTGVIARAQARRFFETYFTPLSVRPDPGGFLTGYFEPEFPGSLERAPGYSTPVLGRPADLITKGAADNWPGMPGDLSAARQTANGLLPYFDRAEIDRGALDGKGLEIAWLKDPVDRFVMQVQGSGRIRLPDGRALRLAYAGRNGYPYTSLGRLLTEEEGIAPAQMTMDRLVARLKSDLDQGSASQGLALIRRNRSFVFFRIAEELAETDGPIGGAGVPLTPHRSVAADRAIWAYGLPVWLKGEIPVSREGTGPLARLGIIQDTGSAIVGPARFDLYFGSGPEAGDLAGLVRHRIEATILWPKPEP